MKPSTIDSPASAHAALTSSLFPRFLGLGIQLTNKPKSYLDCSVFMVVE